MRVRGKTVKKTTEEYQLELNVKFNGNIICLEEYILSSTKIKHKCLKHNFEFDSTPNCVLRSKTGCLLCGKELTHDIRSIGDKKYKEMLKEKFDGNIENLEPYITINTSIKHICHKHNYIYMTTPQSILYNTEYGCKYCANEVIREKEIKGIIQFKKEVYDLVGDEYEVTGEYINYSTPLHFIHHAENNINHEFDMAPAVFKRGARCYCCNSINKVIIGYNDLWTTHPSLCEHLLDKNDGFIHSKSYKKLLNWVCPNCGKVFEQAVSNVIRNNGLSCHYCSDGISYPNKFIYNLLNEFKNDLDYLEREYSPDWCVFKDTKARGKYDLFFIYKLQKYIVEMDGGFHYKEYNNVVPLEYIKARDIEKEKLATEHNIVLIRIDCNYTYPENRFNYITNNIMNSYLASLFELSNINFEEINRKCENSVVIETGDLWNNGFTISEIKEKLNLGLTTIRSYLLRCNDLGYTNYNPVDSFNRSVGTKVKYLVTGKIYNTIEKAHEDTGVAKNTIYRHARNITKTSHNWEFV